MVTTALLYLDIHLARWKATNKSLNKIHLLSAHTKRRIMKKNSYHSRDITVFLHFTNIEVIIIYPFSVNSFFHSQRRNWPERVVEGNEELVDLGEVERAGLVLTIQIRYIKKIRQWFSLIYFSDKEFHWNTVSDIWTQPPPLTCI